MPRRPGCTAFALSRKGSGCQRVARASWKEVDDRQSKSCSIDTQGLQNLAPTYFAIVTSLVKTAVTLPALTLPLPREKTAVAVAETYFHWLPRLFHGLVTVTRGDCIRIRLLGLSMLVLRPVASSSRESSLEIVGGLLCGRPGGLLRFVVHDAESARSELEGYVPSLPRWLYRWTQGPLHLWVMRRFARELEERP